MRDRDFHSLSTLVYPTFALHDSVAESQDASWTGWQTLSGELIYQCSSRSSNLAIPSCLHHFLAEQIKIYRDDPRSLSSAI